jgi:predicted metal-binding membrane protein
MSAPVSLTRSGPYASVLLAASAVAWGVLLFRADRAGMPGTMRLGPLAFDGLWTLMMAAMMLPATAPIAATYAQTLDHRRFLRMTAFTAGYLAVWAATGLPAHALIVGAARAARWLSLSGANLAAAIFALNGVYQLSGWKDRCLATCRAPIGLLIRYASWRGAGHDLRAGAHHGMFCLGCCWSLMALLAAFGMMNRWAMIGITVVVVVEKATAAGPVFARIIGAISLVLALAVFGIPVLAPGLI